VGALVTPYAAEVAPWVREVAPWVRELARQRWARIAPPGTSSVDEKCAFRRRL
jgi:hypothetical protein